MAGAVDFTRPRRHLWATETNTDVDASPWSPAWLARQTDRQTDKKTDRQAGRQIYRQPQRERVLFLRMINVPFCFVFFIKHFHY